MDFSISNSTIIHRLGSLTLLLLASTNVSFADDASTQPRTEPDSTPAPLAISKGITGEWFGYRPKIADLGFTVGGAIDYDFSKNFRGGLNTADSTGREITNLNFMLTTDQAMGWHGGTFFLNFQNHEGRNGTEDLVGDAQGFDNQDGPHASQFSLAWYQQTFADDTLRFKIGRVDANTEFAYVINGTQFLNSSFGYSPAILGLPTYPDAALSANVFWTPNEHFYLGGGVYDSNNTERSLILSGHPNELRSNSGGLFSIVEAGAKWTVLQQNLPGRLGLGGYFASGQYPRFDESMQNGASGPYGVLDQTLWQNSASDGSTTGIGLFAQGALADNDLSLIDRQAGAGFAWTGPIPIPSRAADLFGIGITYAHFSSEAMIAKEYELAIEGFYKIQFTPWFDVQPDIQYILNPGGDGKPDAVVATIRIEIDF